MNPERIFARVKKFAPRSALLATIVALGNTNDAREQTLPVPVPLTQITAAVSYEETPRMEILLPQDLWLQEATVLPNEGIKPPEGKLAGKRICLDPGHDNIYSSGTAGRDSSARVPYHPSNNIPLYERYLALNIAYKLKEILESEGAEVCITRNADGSLARQPYDFTGDGKVRTEGQVIEDGNERIQPRIDQINEFGAEIAISIHFNGLDDPTASGTEVYYSNTGANQENNRRLAANLMNSIMEELNSIGFQAQNRGILSDRYERYSPEITSRILTHRAQIIAQNGHDPDNCYDCKRLLILGNNPSSFYPGNYIAALAELEFLSNPRVVENLIMRPDSLDLFAQGLFKGILSYFENEQGE